MEIGYQTLERLLVTLYGLSEPQRGALLGRFKYLQRLGGFGAASSSRARARYDLADLLRLLLIFELIDVGCTPARALRIVRTHWPDLRVNLGYAWHDARARLAGTEPKQMLWTIVPHALSELGAGTSMVDVDVLDRAGELPPSDVLAWDPGEALAGERHAIFLHLPRLLAACHEAFAIVAPAKCDPFQRAMDRLAKTHVVHEAK